MASVPPGRWPELCAQAQRLLTTLHRHLPTPPQPLDEGGLWDCWVQAQVDDQPSQRVDLARVQGSVDRDGLEGFEGLGGQEGWVNLVGLPSAANLAGARWVSLTLTLACAPELQATLAGWLEPPLTP